jgi:hypothetical protein
VRPDITHQILNHLAFSILYFHPAIEISMLMSVTAMMRSKATGGMRFLLAR